MIDNGTINSIFPNWTIKQLIGSGSYGKVYEMERVEGDAVYRSALKVISIPQNDGEIKARLSEGESEESVRAYYADVTNNLLNENRVMAGLKGNSNIVSYEDHQVIRHENGMGSDIFIRMELLTSFIDYMAENRIDEATVIRLGIDMCKALEVCEKKKIIHRDIKPGNIFVSDTGDFKLGDFGIARTIDMTSGGLSKKGTYRYMAPEVYRGEAYGRTVDICSLGLVMYYLMNGNRTPFLPPAPASVTYNDEENALLRRMNGERIAPPANASSGLASIILKACAFDPSMRYQSAAQLRADLEALRAGRFQGVRMQQAPPAPPVQPARQPQTARQVPAAMRQAQAPGSVHDVSMDRSYRPARGTVRKKAGASKTRQILIAAVAAIVIVLIGIPLLLHLTKAPGSDTGSEKNGGAGTAENVKVADAKPDTESLEAFLSVYDRYSDSVLEGEGFNSKLTSPAEALVGILREASIVDYDAYPGEGSPYANWEDNQGKVDPLQWVLDEEWYEPENEALFVAFDKDKVDWIMRNILNYSQEDIEVAAKAARNKNEITGNRFYEEKGKYYFITSPNEIEWTENNTNDYRFVATLDSLQRDGDYYNVNYTAEAEYTGSDPDVEGYDYPLSQTARMQYKEIDGECYWALCEHGGYYDSIQ